MFSLHHTAPSSFYWIFKHLNELKELYSETPHTYHLDGTINILFAYHISVSLYICSSFFLFLFFFGGLGIKFRTLHMLGKHCSTELYPQLSSCFLSIKVSYRHQYTLPLNFSACMTLIRVWYLLKALFIEVNFTYSERQES
jgi:hypothetical protein